MLKYTPKASETPETWDARGFLAGLTRATCHEQRVRVIRSTMRVFDAGCYALPDGRVVVLPRDACTRNRARLHAAVQRLAYAHLPALAALPTVPAHCPVEVVCGDCVDAAAQLVAAAAGEEGSSIRTRVAVLDMASARHPGGGYLRGAGAQEENLCRRSNLWAHLDVPRLARNALYPLPARGALYARDVLFVRANEPAAGYAFLPAPLRLDVVAVAAPVHPPTVVRRAGAAEEEDYAREADRAATLDTVRAALQACAQNGAHDVVLSALGCGAFRHPPAAVARLFRRALDEYAPCLRRVVFAVYDDHNARGAGNYAPFHRILHGYVPGSDSSSASSSSGCNK